MDTKGILTACILDSTNNLLAQHDISPIEIDPPVLTDKVSEEALAAYRQNAGPDANAWAELERMAKKATMFDEINRALTLLVENCHDIIDEGRFDHPTAFWAIGHAAIVLEQAKELK